MPETRTLWVLLLLLLVTVLTIAPMLTILWGSVMSEPPGIPGNFTLLNYVNGYTGTRFQSALTNTILFGFGSSALAFVLGSYLAWVTERTNAPLRRIIYALALTPILVPGVLTAIAWVLILSDTIGLGNWALMSSGLTSEPVFDAYSMWSMIWADGTDSLTLPFLLMAAAFRAMDPSLEEASAAAGARQVRTMRRVTLPLMTPAMLAAYLIVFIKAIEGFEVPAVLGIPGGISVFATEVWLASERHPGDPNLAAAFAVGYLVIAMIGVSLYYKATGMSEKFTTITGKGYKPKRMDLGAMRFVHGGVAVSLLLVIVVVPFMVMLYTALVPYYSPPTDQTLAAMSFDNFREVFRSPLVARALKNIMIAGGGAAFIAMLISALVSWVVLRTDLRGRRLLDAAAFAPIAFPGVVFGLALVWLYLSVPVPIYATLWIIGIGFVGAYLPYGLRATHASLSQVGRELEEASAACGASFSRTFVRVVLPLMTSGLLVGFIYVFSRAFKGLSLPIMLAGPGTEVPAVMVYDLYDGGEYTVLNALGVLMFLFLLLLSALAQRAGQRFGHMELA